MVDALQSHIEQTLADLGRVLVVLRGRIVGFSNDLERLDMARKVSATCC